MILACRKLSLSVLAVLLFVLTIPVRAADDPALFPLADVQPGMKGVTYTIFQGDQVEKVDLEVIGILHNAIGPKQDVILVRLLGDKVEQTGVVAGMSGSPVYFDGKLAGALALKLGTFTKEAIGGVTPIASMLEIETPPVSPAPKKPGLASGNAAGDALRGSAGAGSFASNPAAARIRLPEEFAQRVAAGAGQFLVPIETPLVGAGLYPETLARFGKDFAAWGMAAMAGGTAPASPQDAQLKPGDMVGIDLIRGDLSLSSGCTVTVAQDNRVLACGHPLFGFGAVEMPLSRAHVVMTLASAAASTKIITTGGTIGTLTQDRQSAVMGHLGAGPPMIPVDLVLATPEGEKKFHFEVIESPQLAPVLVAVATYNGMMDSPTYGQGTSVQFDGTIVIKGHTPVRLESLFASTDEATPVGLSVATAVQSAFARIYSNPYEVPQIERVDVRVTALQDRRWAIIDSAWMERSEVRPGETVGVKVLLRPYRGAPFIQELPVTIPEQSARGTLQLVVSDADFLNRNVPSLAASQGQLPGLEELIRLLNRERRNDRLYATLVQSTPTIFIEDKEMPNAPTSMINVLDQRQNPGSARVLWQSADGEWSVEMHRVIAGQRMLTITVK
jgi:SpoIVB peptidase S55